VLRLVRRNDAHAASKDKTNGHPRLRHSLRRETCGWDDGRLPHVWAGRRVYRTGNRRASDLVRPRTQPITVLYSGLWWASQCGARTYLQFVRRQRPNAVSAGELSAQAAHPLAGERVFRPHPHPRSPALASGCLWPVALYRLHLRWTLCGAGAATRRRSPPPPPLLPARPVLIMSFLFRKTAPDAADAPLAPLPSQEPGSLLAVRAG